MNKKIIKNLILIIVVYVSIAAFVSFATKPKSDVSENTKDSDQETLSIWYWDSSIVSIFEDFKNKYGYTNLNLDYTYIPNYEYSSCLSKAIAAGNPLPDICVLHGNFLSDFISYPIWEEFDKEPYSLNEELFPEELIPHMENKNGNLVAIPVDVPASGIAYRTTAMQKAFGFSAPEDVIQNFQSWNDLIDKAYEIKSTSSPDIFLFASLDDPGYILFNQTDNPYITNSTFTESEHIKASFEILCKLKSLNLVDNISSCSPKWYETFSDDKYLFTPWSSWLMQNGSFENNKNNDWKLIAPPEGSYGYGYSVCVIPKKSDKKDIAFEFLNYWLMSDEGAINQLKKSGLVLAHMQTSDTIDKNFNIECFGEQNIGNVIFEDLVPNAKIYPTEEHATAILSAFEDTIAAIKYTDGMNANAAFEYFKEKLLEAIPNLTFE
ncbi:MAG: extracellular solute-binding protein [Eubacteriales bacterium]|nr:extracellular solute-binding protein [Eubacteriales bacterium]